jgi:hypothetical protein
MRALTRRARAGVISAVALVAAIALWSHVNASDDGVSWGIRSETEDRQTSTTTPDGKTTSSETTTTQTTQHSSDGQDLTDNQSRQANQDGSSHEHEATSHQKADGNSEGYSRDEDRAPAGNGHKHEEYTETDKDGNRTTTTIDDEFDSHGQCTSHTEHTTRDKVEPTGREPGKGEPKPPAPNKPDIHVAEPSTLCFSIAIDLHYQMADTPAMYEDHHIETVYRQVGYWLQSSPGCRFASLKPGETCALTIASIHGTATGRHEDGTQKSSSLDKNFQESYSEGEFKRDAQGATITFEIVDVPAGDAEEYVGNCAAQRWELWPPQFKLSEEEIRHFDTVHKTLPLNLPLGENGCIGKGTAVLSARR